jgi:methionyl-tRNA formyltransferase
MSTAPAYPYAQGDLLERRHTYFYSPYGGRDFVAAWSRSRTSAARELAEARGGHPEGSGGSAAACELFGRLRRALRHGDEKQEDVAGQIARLVQRFEVSKRVYSSYDAGLRPRNAADYRALAPYVEFAELLEATYQARQQIQALNALLKCLDILVAHRAQLEPALRERVVRLIEREAEHVAAIAGRVGVRLPC